VLLQAAAVAATARRSTRNRVIIVFSFPSSRAAPAGSACPHGPELAVTLRGGLPVEAQMKWMGVYLLGYALLIAGALLALWKTGVLASIGPFWVVVGLLVAIGIGIMISVGSSGRKENITIDRN
jgi:hypothetical protein